ncbi:MAG: phosphatase PAP2 family protein [Acidobacteria bacterium]|nr:phosphatase PAP2 family protein [Acidobacteriota bacterium]
MPISNVFRNIYKLLNPLHSTDRLLIAFWCLLSLISFFFRSRIPDWPLIILADIAAVLLVIGLALLQRASGSGILRCVRDWSAFPFVLFTYKQVYFMISPIHQGKDYDQLLMTIDHLLFRIHITEWLAGFSNPFLTELLQIAYSLFYVFFIAIGMELYRKQERFQFRYFRFTVVYGFLISYACYFFLPAVGPRFTLHDFSQTDVELPGLLLTPALRWFINVCESIPPGVSNAVALAGAQRDVFPSGHAMMTLIAIIFAFKYRLMIRYYVFGVGMLLILATVYLRYHYLIDLVAGAILVLLCLLTSRKMHGLLKDKSCSKS